MNWNVGYDLFQRNTVLVGRNLFSVSLAIPPQYWFECRMEIFTAFVFFLPSPLQKMTVKYLF